MSVGGIAGELRFDGRSSNPSTVKAMCDAQIHRGPDGEGYYTNGTLGLGMRHLAIVDASNGTYPLRNEDGSIHLVSDGEVYVFSELRNKLEQRGHEFCSNSSAESVIHGYEEWGVGCLDELDGMFAFALWDQPRRLLWIARDRVGIKPIYYHKSSKLLAFASEIKPLLRHPDISLEANASVIRQYLQAGLDTGEDASEDTFFAGINRMPPANYLAVRQNGVVEQERYWKPQVSRRLGGEISSATIETIRTLFLEAVRQLLVNEARLGASLSGGLDSSSVVCAAKKISSTRQPFKTFSALFPGEAIDESEHVRVVCNATGAANYAVNLTADDFWRDLPTLLRCQEEPFSWTSLYAQWRVMQRARECGVKTMLEGHGPDTLLCGFPLHFWYYFMTLIRHRRYRRLLSEVLLSYDLMKVSELLPVILACLRFLFSGISKKWNSMSHPRTQSILETPNYDLAAKLEIEIAETLPSVLRHLDKNSMWHNIEVREPFLQKTFFEYCASLPLDQKMRDGWTKYALRLAMKDVLPEPIRLRRDKIGFQIPLKKWIENELRQKLRDFFSDSSLRATRYYDVQTARTVLGKHSLTTREVAFIWHTLCLELWYREFFP
jgi:asparagine synthase (glutamine-hydrolysing)